MKLFNISSIVIGFSVALSFSMPLRAQMGVGTPVPHASAALEVQAANKGLLIPRVTLQNAEDNTTISNAPGGMIVYNLNDNPGFTGQGYYINLRQQGDPNPNWVKLLAGNTVQDGWGQLGNSNINSSIHFLGTTNNQPLVFAAGLVANTSTPQRQGLLAPARRSYYFNGVQNALSFNTNFNVGIGHLAIHQGGLVNNTVAIGSFAASTSVVGGELTESVAIGDSALSRFFNHSVVMVGKNAGRRGGFENATAIGWQALATATGKDNTVVGSEALFHNEGVTNNAAENVAVGSAAMKGGRQENFNTAIGAAALTGSNVSDASATRNVAIGAYAFYTPSAALSINAIDAVAIGNRAMGGGLPRSNVVAIGYEALQACNGCDGAVAVGWASGRSITSGGNNTLVGTNAGSSITNGGGNTAIGTSALGGVANGNNNTAIGFLAYASGNFSNSTAIGFLASVSASNQVRIGNTSITSITGQVAWSPPSDARLKTHVQEDIPGIDFLKKLNPITYQFDRNKLNDLTYGSDKWAFDFPSGIEPRRRTGLSAQQVAEVLEQSRISTNLVDRPADENGVLGLRYELMVVPLIKTIQEQQATIQQVKALISQLENQLSLIQ